MRKIIIITIALLLVSTSFASNKDSLTNQQLEHMAGFCKVWGFLKYYHPEVKSNSLNWDSIMSKYIPKILEVRSNASFNIEINKLLQEVSPLAGEGVNLKTKKFDDIFNNIDLNWIDNTKLFTKNNIAELNYIAENYHAIKAKYPNEYYGKPYWKIKNEYNLSFECSQLEKNYIIAFNYWNFVNYFYPTKSLMNKNWDEILKNLIQNCYKNPTEIHQIISKTHTYLDDGNATCNYIKKERTPFQFKTIKDTTFISNIYEPALLNQLRVGDEVVDIKKSYLDEQKKVLAMHTSAATPQAKTLSIDKKLPIASTEPKEITVKDNAGKLKTVDYSKKEVVLKTKKKRKEKEIKPWAILKHNNFATIDLDRISPYDVAKVMKRIKKTDGVILDFRNYPNSAPQFLRYLTPSDALMYERYFPIFEYPGAYRKESYKQRSVIPIKYTYTKPVVILIDENTNAFAELMAMTFQSYENVVLIGRNSSSNHSKVMSLILPEKIKLSFSAEGTTFPYGEQFHKKGLAPDVYVEQTISAFKQGKDEIFQAAINYLIGSKTKNE